LPSAIIIDANVIDENLNAINNICHFKNSRAIYLPLIYISKRNNLQTRLKSVRAGGDAFMAKPVDIVSLFDYLDKNTITGSKEKYRISNIEYRISNIEYRISNIEYRISNIEY
jgi:DNA-binding response OmpR family regulator